MPGAGAASDARAVARVVEAPGARRRRLLGALLPVLAMALSATVLGCGIWGLHRFVTRSPHFQLREIRATGVRHLRAEDIGISTGVALGDNIFSFSLDQVARRLGRDQLVGPWIAEVRLHRELPSSLAVEIVEREAAACVELGSLYLADAGGEVFKRATLDEAASLPLVTGVARDAYVHDREGAQALIHEAVTALSAWRARSGPIDRPAIGEVHVDAGAGTTLYTHEGGVAVRLGRVDERSMPERLARVDAVWAALAASGARPQIIHADAPTHAERVTVRLASRRVPVPGAVPVAVPGAGGPTAP